MACYLPGCCIVCSAGLLPDRASDERSPVGENKKKREREKEVCMQECYPCGDGVRIQITTPYLARGRRKRRLWDIIGI